MTPNPLTIRRQSDRYYYAGMRDESPIFTAKAHEVTRFAETMTLAEVARLVLRLRQEFGVECYAALGVIDDVKEQM